MQYPSETFLDVIYHDASSGTPINCVDTFGNSMAKLAAGFVYHASLMMDN